MFVSVIHKSFFFFFFYSFSCLSQRKDANGTLSDHCSGCVPGYPPVPGSYFTTLNTTSTWNGGIPGDSEGSDWDDPGKEEEEAKMNKWMNMSMHTPHLSLLSSSILLFNLSSQYSRLFLCHVIVFSRHPPLLSQHLSASSSSHWRARVRQSRAQTWCRTTAILDCHCRWAKK